jgi:peptidoglycan L-alanyl-D-glutamate endopeptidase CwlK
MPKFGKVSELHLKHVHPDLIKLARFVIHHWDCTVTDGIRTTEEQKLNIARKVSKTMDSKHLPRNEAGELDENGLAHAIDMMPYPVDWAAIEKGIAAVKKVDPGMQTLEAYGFVGFVQGAAAAMGIDLRVGADWDNDRNFANHTFVDLPHFELDR